MKKTNWQACGVDSIVIKGRETRGVSQGEEEPDQSG